MRTAFKEWGVIVEALAHGEQVLLLRKGGIHEGTGGFRPVHAQFWFLPTRFHQQRDAVLPGAVRHWDAVERQGRTPEILRIASCASVVAQWRLDSAEVLPALHGFHVWRDDVLQARFEWGQPGGVSAMAVRVSTLPSPVELPWRQEYGGCRSWVDLDQELDPSSAVAVLNDQVFGERLARLENLLGKPLSGA